MENIIKVRNTDDMPRTISDLAPTTIFVKQDDDLECWCMRATNGYDHIGINLRFGNLMPTSEGCLEVARIVRNGQVVEITQTERGER